MTVWPAASSYNTALLSVIWEKKEKQI